MNSKLSAQDIQIIIVLSEFNTKITERLLKGAVDAFLHYQGLESNLKIYRVPGAFEIPGTIQQIFHHQQSNAIVALGSVIRGETPHFDFVSSSCANGLTKVSIEANKPVLFGVLTTETEEQAIRRADPKKGNKGAEVALSAMELLEQYASI